MAASITVSAPDYSNEEYILDSTAVSLHHGDVRPVSLPGNYLSRPLVGEALKDRIGRIDHDNCEAGDEDAFFVADLGEVYRQHLRWKMTLGRVIPHYAVKCNPDPQVLRLLDALGTGFDCASKAEIEQVLAIGVHPSRIVYAQPCKTKSYLRYAAQHHVKQVMFDSADELYKTKDTFPDAELFLRIITDDSASLCRLSLKFGAELDATQDLLELARKLGLNVVGVAFHIGSGASDPSAFYKAVRDARFVFDQAADVGFELHTLDVGGGFCADDTFEPMAAVLSEALDAYFPPEVRIIGEPGRYYVATAFTLACHVIARRTITDPTLGSTSYKLYINDGVYGNFSNIMFDHQNPVPRVLRSGNRFVYDDAKAGGSSDDGSGYDTPGMVECSVWGPTCDGLDCISRSVHLNEVLDIGDWMYFEDMGAYTKCSATKFNGFSDQHEVVYVCSEPDLKEALGIT